MNANEQNKNNRGTDEVNVPTYLEQKGLLGIIEEYLNGEKVKGIIHDAFIAVLDKAKGIADRVPENLKERAEAATEVFEESVEEVMAEAVCGLFKQDLASHLYGLEGYVCTDAVAELIKAYAAEGKMDGKAAEIAEAVADQLLDKQKEALVAFCLPEAESEEDARAIIEAIMGDELPEGLMGIGIIMGCPFDEDDDEDDDEEE